MVRQKHSLPKFSQLWDRHEKLYRRIFVEALRRLSAKPNISGNENDVSKQLYPIVIAVCREMAKQKDREIQPPSPEAHNWATNTEERDNEFTDKRPDFTCNCIDKQALTDEYYTIPLHIECKLLGERTSSNWVINRNYVTNGIARFVSESHRYGNRASSGIMIGYIISMTHNVIQEEVNSYIENELPSLPPLDFADSSTPLETRQSFTRKQVKPSRFALTHLWIDIRGNYTQDEALATNSGG